MGALKSYYQDLIESGDMEDIFEFESTVGKQPKEKSIPRSKQCHACNSEGTRSLGSTKFCYWHWVSPGSPGDPNL